MTIKINLIKIVWVFIILLVLSTYPANWFMMKNEWGMYDNNPNKEWERGPRNEKMIGPYVTDRTWALIASPIFTPWNGIYHLAKVTCSE